MASKRNLGRLRDASWQKAALLAGVALLLILVGVEIFNLGWGSGSWLGRLSDKWVLTLVPFYFFIAFIFYLVAMKLYQPRLLARFEKQFISARTRLGKWNWILLTLLLLAPAWFVFYSPWGGLFTGFFFRIILFVLTLLLAAFLLTKHKTQLVEWKPFLFAGLLLGVVLVLAESFVLVSEYPFALHWSEGNRLWDYSLAFGSDRYNYTGTELIFAWIDAGRQNLWGLAFLVPNASIWVVRLWSAILVTVPYAILGWIAFRPRTGNREHWLVFGLWSLIFLNQGPIYTPLVLAAILVALARRQPLWLAVPLLFIAGDYAGSSRFTWRFAPAIWAVIVTFGDSVLLHGKLIWQDWLRAAALGLAGIWTKGLPILVGILIGLLPFLAAAPVANGGEPPTSIETLPGLQAVSTHQPFLWERLFPNPIYPPGILLGLALATLPLILLLVYLARKQYWKTVLWQQVATLLGLGALLVVGVIASAKVGGGTDLHNIDMFLVGLVLLAALAWESGLAPRLDKLLKNSAPVRWLLTGMVLIPAFLPMVEGRPLELPAGERTLFVLQRIQDKVACARQYGEVLFMDQRQLLTFGLMDDLPLVVDYEKKYVMDQALSVDAEYFKLFHADLAAGRFALIVSEREAILYKEAEIESIGDSLIEENNAWVTWVTTPLLQHYESVGEFKDVAVELFMPIERTFDCP